jgi:hypothetical protein
MKSLGVPIQNSRMGKIVVTVHGQPTTLIPRAIWAKLAHGPYLNTVVHVELVPRHLVRRLWSRDMGSKPFPGQYAFRGYTRGNRIILLSDATETPASLTWLLLHELSHVQINNAPILDRALRSIPKPRDYLTSDVAHGQWPEEQLANRVADQLAPHFDSRPGLNRIWWRRRTRRVR